MTFRPGLLTAVLSAAFLGCMAENDTPPDGSASRPSADVPAEPSWAEQVAAVREGRSEKIRVSRPVSSEEFRALAEGCGGLRTLVLDRCDLSSDDLAVLRSTPRLRWLKFGGPVDDAGVEAIAACRELEILNLPAGLFTDAGLERIVTLDGLTLLRFSSPGVTDAGIAAVAGLPRLRFLHLIDVSITDEGLRAVAGIATLESFYLDGGLATDAGLRRLLEARPNLHLHVDSRHLPDDPNADGH